MQKIDERIQTVLDRPLTGECLRIMILHPARELLIALWRLATADEVPQGVFLRPGRIAVSAVAIWTNRG